MRWRCGPTRCFRSHDQETWSAHPLQLRPFQFVNDIFSFDTGSVSALMSNPAVMQVTLNVILFAPLGWFIRQLADRGVIVATVTGFVISGLIEFTQVSGIWGLYRCAYRIFDVNDLMMNTLGALLGSLLSLLFFRRRVAGKDAGAPQPITTGRRFLGIVCDMFIAWVGIWVIVAATALASFLVQGGEIRDTSPTTTTLAFVIPFLAQLLSVLNGSVTLGERLVLIRADETLHSAAIARPLRFIFGIGGYMILTQWTFPGSGLLLIVLTIATVIMVFTTREHRGLACTISGLDIRDARSSIQPR